MSRYIILDRVEGNVEGPLYLDESQEPRLLLEHYALDRGYKFTDSDFSTITVYDDIDDTDRFHLWDKLKEKDIIGKFKIRYVLRTEEDILSINVFED